MKKEYEEVVLEYFHKKGKVFLEKHKTLSIGKTKALFWKMTKYSMAVYNPK